ncbi:MAG: TetR/AcrR family transcriptional regulator [Gracilibacteraceae bacterium]|jgi:AcrR family transcriptional regulator|nr:TetR/AcrR family transcriptional regulator [Gracilibacteraceae bacterium]
MPKPTFFNLPKQRQRAIEQAALEEFAASGYDGSSVNRIVEGSRIAKGSFYQYFNDKKDLYYHLIDTLGQAKLKVLESVLRDSRDRPFSENMAELFRQAYVFADGNPLYFAVGLDFASKQKQFVSDFLDKYRPVALDILGGLLRQARERGELRPDLDMALTAAFINTLINHCTIELILTAENKARRNEVTTEILLFIGRAVLRP